MYQLCATKCLADKLDLEFRAPAPGKVLLIEGGLNHGNDMPDIETDTKKPN